MSYNITLTSGQTLVNIDDGKFDDTHTSLNLFGKNFAGYGDLLNENFVKLLENFSMNSAPPNALQGQLWWDSNNGLLKIKTTGDWKIVSGPTASAIQPNLSTIGDTWWNTDTSQLNVYNGSDWTTVGPVYTAAQGKSGPFALSIADLTANLHTAIGFYIGGTVVGIFSKDTTYTTSQIAGFSTIKPGFNLPVGTSQYYGNSENSLSLGGVLAANYIRSDVDSGTSHKFSINNTDGLHVGTQGTELDFSIKVQNNAVRLSSHTSGQNTEFYVTLAGVPSLALRLNGSTGLVTVAGDPVEDLGVATRHYVDNTLATAGSQWIKIDGSTPITGNLVPAGNSVQSLGSALNPFNEIRSTSFIGNSITAASGIFNFATVALTPFNDASATSKHYVDTVLSIQNDQQTAYTDLTVGNLIGGAPGNMSTLGALAAALNGSTTFGVDTNNALLELAPKFSPFLDGIPTALTAPSTEPASGRLATTLYVKTAIDSEHNDMHNTLSNYAQLDSPSFSGTPVLSNPPSNNNIPNAIASTNFVVSELTNSMNGLVTSLNEFARLDSPGFIGYPSATTASSLPVTDSTDKLATTAFVNAKVTDAINAITTLPTSIGQLTNARLIGGSSFNGTADITVQSATSGFTVSGGKLNVGASTASQAAMNIAVGTTPQSNITADGDLWVDGNGLNVRLGGAPKTVWHSGNLNITQFTAPKANQVVVGTTGVGVYNVVYNLGDNVYSSSSVQLNPANGAINAGILTLSSNATIGGDLNVTGEIAGGLSDDRLKTRLGNIENALDKICTLTGFYYEANDKAQSLGFDTKRQVGVSAQKTQETMPELIRPAPVDPEYMTLQYEKFVPFIIEAIKELRAQVDEIKSVLK
jgi:hypothetical protein